MFSILFLFFRSQNAASDRTNFASNRKNRDGKDNLYVDVDTSEIQNGYYYFDTSTYSTENQRVILRLSTENSPLVTRLELNYAKYSSSFYVKIPEDYPNLTLIGRKDKYHFYNLIYHANDLILDGENNCMVNFYDAKGKVNIKYNPTLAVGDVYPFSNTNPFIISSEESDKEIDNIVFDVNQSSFTFEGGIAVVKSIIVDSFIHCRISNCKLQSSVNFYFGSTLEIDDSSSFGSVNVDVPISNERENSNSPYIKSYSLKEPPTNIRVVQDKKNPYSGGSNNKIWISQSTNKFKCGKWAAAIMSKIENFEFKYSCVEEDNNTFNLYALPMDIPKKKKIMDVEIIALIAVSCLSGVIIIASIIVYFVIIRPNSKM